MLQLFTRNKARADVPCALRLQHPAVLSDIDHGDRADPLQPSKESKQEEDQGAFLVGHGYLRLVRRQRRSHAPAVATQPSSTSLSPSRVRMAFLNGAH